MPPRGWTRRAGALIVAVGLLAGHARAGINQWTSYGPAGGSVTALAIDPTATATLYAGIIGGGVYKSTDGGQHWTAINTGLTNTHVTALAIDPQTPTTLYAGTGGSGVFAIEQESPTPP